MKLTRKPKQPTLSMRVQFICGEIIAFAILVTVIVGALILMMGGSQ